MCGHNGQGDCTCNIVPYSRKLSREKAFANFKILWLFAKVFFVKFWGMASFVSTSEQSAKFFPVKIFFSTNLRKFSPAKVSRYTVILATQLNIFTQTQKYEFVNLSVAQANTWLLITSMKCCLDLEIQNLYNKLALISMYVQRNRIFEISKNFSTMLLLHSFSVYCCTNDVITIPIGCSAIIA